MRVCRLLSSSSSRTPWAHGKNQPLDMNRIVRFGPVKPNFGTPLSHAGMTRLGNPFDMGMWSHTALAQPHAVVNPDQHLFGHLAKLVDPIELLSFQDLIDAGAHYGHREQEMHPLMSPYIFGTRRGYHIIDTYHTLAAIRTVCRLTQFIILKGGQVLWVCLDEKMKPMTDYYARQAQQPYIIDKWRPGFFTNFEEVYKNALGSKKLDLDPKKSNVGSAKRKAAKKQYMANAFSTMTGPPSIVLMINMHRTKHIIYEASQTQIPTIGIVDTNLDPSGLDYPITVNDENHIAMGIVCKTISLCMKDAMDYRARMLDNNGLYFGHFPSENFSTEPPFM
jgi:small subunit ribosomal protein S2